MDDDGTTAMMQALSRGEAAWDLAGSAETVVSRDGSRNTYGQGIEVDQITKWQKKFQQANGLNDQTQMSPTVADPELVAFVDIRGDVTCA